MVCLLADDIVCCSLLLLNADLSFIYLLCNVFFDPCQVFEAFGTIELVQLPRDEAGLCKGFAFIQVTTHHSADKVDLFYAHSKFSFEHSTNNKPLLGRKM